MNAILDGFENKYSDHSLGLNMTCDKHLHVFLLCCNACLIRRWRSHTTRVSAILQPVCLLAYVTLLYEHLGTATRESLELRTSGSFALPMF